MEPASKRPRFEENVFSTVPRDILSSILESVTFGLRSWSVFNQVSKQFRAAASNPTVLYRIPISITANEVYHLAQLPQVRSLFMSGVQDGTIHALQRLNANIFKRLEHLAITGSRLTDDGLHCLVLLAPKLLVLDLSDSTSITTAGLRNALELPRLRDINVSFCTGITEIPELPPIVSLSISGCTSVVDLPTLPPTLEYLDVSDTEITKFEFPTALTYLNVDNCTMDPTHFGEIAKLPNIEYLNLMRLREERWTHEDFDILTTAMPKLTELVLNGYCATDEAATQTSKVQKLKLVSADLAHDTFEMLGRIMPDLESFTLNQSNLDGVCFCGIGKCRKMTNLVLSNCNLGELEPLIHFPHIVTLDISSNPNISDWNNLSRIPFLGGLTDLSISWTHVRDVHLQALLECPLKRLDLKYCSKLTDLGMHVVGSIKTLTCLHLNGCRITDIALRPISTLPRLRTLSLSYCKDIKNVSRLALCRRLQTLALGHPDTLVNLAVLSGMMLKTLTLFETRVDMKVCVFNNTLRELCLFRCTLIDADRIPCRIKLSIDGK